MYFCCSPLLPPAHTQAGMEIQGHFHTTEVT